MRSLHSGCLQLQCLSALRKLWELFTFELHGYYCPASWGSELWMSGLVSTVVSGGSHGAFCCIFASSPVSALVNSLCLSLLDPDFPLFSSTKHNADSIPLHILWPGDSLGPWAWAIVGFTPSVFLLLGICTVSCTMSKNGFLVSFVPSSTYLRWEDKSGPSWPKAKPHSLFLRLLFLF